ncbi:hypothetical protein [Leptonema illini]|nr:hypothetical protein [Leptonema illini]
MISSFRWSYLCLAPVALAMLTAGRLSASTPEQTIESRIYVGAPDRNDVSYIYVDGNEAGAAGGHTAIRAGDSVYHFQRVPEGFFIVERTPWDGFLFSYSRLQNRNIHETPLNISAEDRQKIVSRLTDLQIRHRWLLQRRSALLDRIERLQELLEQGRVTVSYPVLGYFRPGRSKLWSMHRHLRFQASEIGNVSTMPGDESEIESRLENALHLFLKDGFDFYDETFIVTDIPLPAVSLNPLESVLAESLRSAVQSETDVRPDRARTALEILVLMEALRRSQELGVWVVPRMALTTEPDIDDGPILSVDNPEVQIFASMFRSRSDALIASLRAGDAPSRLLTSFNRTLQSASILDLARRRGASVVLSAGAVMTTPSLSLIEERAYDDRDRLASELSRAEMLYAALESEMRDELSYALFTKNCVTELLAELQQISGADLPVESPTLSGLFIPFVSERYVADALGNGERILYRSYRNELLLIEHDPVAETSTISSRYYVWNERDSWFLFFSEDRPLARPLFGVVNLFLGGAQTVIGLPSAPFDRGQRLSRGIRGMAFSLSEVAFISVRKGTFRGGHPIFYSFPSPATEKKKVTNR